MPAKPIDQARLEMLKTLPLKSGRDSLRGCGMCTIEAYNWLRGGPHTDDYDSAVIGEFVRTLNDALPSDEAREILKPVVLAMAAADGSLDVSDAAEQARGLRVADWYHRHWAPTWIELAGHVEHAKALRDLPPIASWRDVANIEPLLIAAGDAHMNVARVATDDVAGRAAWDVAYTVAIEAADSALESTAYGASWRAMAKASRSFAWCPAHKAAKKAARRAAESAASSAAWPVAMNAEQIDAEAAASSALATTVAKLQASAVDLVLQLIELRTA